MAMASKQEALILARQRVEESQARIQQQLALIESLKAAGNDTGGAELALAALIKVLSVAIKQGDRIERGETGRE
jgi:hypothetical protein